MQLETNNIFFLEVLVSTFHRGVGGGGGGGIKRPLFPPPGPGVEISIPYFHPGGGTNACLFF